MKVRAASDQREPTDSVVPLFRRQEGLEWEHTWRLLLWSGLHNTDLCADPFARLQIAVRTHWLRKARVRANLGFPASRGLANLLPPEDGDLELITFAPRTAPTYPARPTLPEKDVD